ncbi:MAG: hypothetical protein CVU38_08860 [Chloroflexi bacterium HGW-Chloroflexi-1]|nr:MAG: hypothetical protein CVU38_08860 [Chloroflexi bacterium HGW-Chloroflexi-1]
MAATVSASSRLPVELALRVHAEQHRAAVGVSERHQRLGQPVGRGVGQHFELEADASVEDAAEGHADLPLK